MNATTTTAYLTRRNECLEAELKDLRLRAEKAERERDASRELALSWIGSAKMLAIVHGAAATERAANDALAILSPHPPSEGGG